MYFVGLHFLYSMTSATLIGSGGMLKELPRPFPCGLGWRDVQGASARWKAASWAGL
jgi:hypothetical protein